MSDVQIRPAKVEDLPQLTEIYNHYVLETPITFDIEPFSVEQRAAWLEQFADTGRFRLWVAEDATRILGYAGSMRFRPKAAYEGSVEVTVYLRPDVQTRGLGTRLYRALFDSLSGQDVHRAYAGVTLPNQASLALHERFGFRAAGFYDEVGRKFGRYWSVQWMEKKFEG